MHMGTPSFVVINGRKLAFAEVCPAEPLGTIVLLPGIACKRQVWFKQLGAFGKQYRTISVDHRDIGESDPFTETYGTADQADDAAAVLRMLGVERATAVGFSMGGFIGQELALRHPDLVEKLVLTGTSAGGPAFTFGKWPLVLTFQALTWMPRPQALDAGRAEIAIYERITTPTYFKREPGDRQIIEQIGRATPQSTGSFKRQFHACLHHNTVGRLPDIKVPTLIIHGEDDPLIPLRNGHYLAESIRDARLVTYPFTGHMPFLERAVEYNRNVMAFMGGEDVGITYQAEQSHVSARGKARQAASSPAHW